MGPHVPSWLILFLLWSPGAGALGTHCPPIGGKWAPLCPRGERISNAFNLLFTCGAPRRCDAGRPAPVRLPPAVRLARTRPPPDRHPVAAGTPD